MPNARTLAEYPEGYFRIVERFRSTSEPFCIPGERRQLLSLRRDLYRFRALLSDNYSSDPYAAGLADLMKELVFTLDPSSGEPTDHAILTISKRLTADILLSDIPPLPATKAESQPPTQERESYDKFEIERLISERSARGREDGE